MRRSNENDDTRAHDAQEVLDWLAEPDEDAAPQSSGRGGAGGSVQGSPAAQRYERGAYAGRRSTVGTERSHGASGSSRQPRRVKRHASAGTVVKRVLLTILAVLIAACVGIGIWFHHLDENMMLDDPELSAALTGVETPFKAYYVLIVGSDARGDEASRGDTIVLARVDPVKNQVTLVSIPRDTYVDIDGYGASKINAALAYGGPALMVKTVSEFAGVPIAHYVEVGFDGLVDIVDAVGGVTVDVPADTTVDDVTLPEGVQTLDGEQALVFVRCRKTYALGDYQRAANQRALIVALAGKVLAAPPWQWPGIIDGISRSIGTDCSCARLLEMMLCVKGLDASSMYTAVVPSYTDTIDDVSYVIAYDDEWAAMMANVNAGLDPNAV